MTTIDVVRYPLVPDGPLAEWVRQFQMEMVRLGYTARTAQSNAYVMACLSRWLDQRGLAPGQVGAVELEQFVQRRRELGYRRWLSVRSLHEMLAFLRQARGRPARAAAAGGRPGFGVGRALCRLPAAGTPVGSEHDSRAGRGR